MFYFYVIQCQTSGKKYKGHTADLDARLNQHNQGKTKSTKGTGPWMILYTESFSTRSEAVAKEKFYKSYAGHLELRHKMESTLDGSN